MNFASNAVSSSTQENYRSYWNPDTDSFLITETEKYDNEPNWMKMLQEITLRYSLSPSLSITPEDLKRRYTELRAANIRDGKVSAKSIIKMAQNVKSFGPKIYQIAYLHKISVTQAFSAFEAIQTEYKTEDISQACFRLLASSYRARAALAHRVSRLVSCQNNLLKRKEKQALLSLECCEKMILNHHSLDSLTTPSSLIEESLYDDLTNWYPNALINDVNFQKTREMYQASEVLW